MSGSASTIRVAAAALAGLVLLGLGACGSSPTPAFDLTAPRQAGRVAGRIAAQLVVAEPVALQAFESERIAVKGAGDAVSVLPDAQWADRLPRLVQARAIQTLENASRTRAVGRPGDGIVADGQLNMDIRAFQLDARTGDAVVEISVKLIDARSGRVIKARLFSARTRVASAAAPEVAQALDRSLSTVLVELVRWIGSAPQAPPEPALRTGSL